MAFKKAVEQVDPQPQQHETVNHFQQSAETVGEGIKDNLITKVATPMGLAMADAVHAEALRVMAQALQSGEAGPLTQQMLNTLSTGVTRPFEKWTAQLETWYEPVALLPSSNESTLS
jgi:hypothetical protein